MSWRTTTLRAVAEVVLGRQRAPQHETGSHVVPYLRAANVKDGSLDLSDVLEMNFTPNEQQIFRLQAGDVLMTEGSGSRSVVGASAVWRGEVEGVVCFQNTLLRLRPRPGVMDGRFLAWWVRGARESGTFASIAGGANIYHLSAERVRQLPVSLPPLEEQRRIADFLDAETSRLAIISRVRSRQIDLLEERRESSARESIAEVPGELVELRRAGVSVTTGPFGTVFAATDYVSGGVPMINPTHIKKNRLEPDTYHTVSRATASRLRRHQLRAGDLVVGRKGDLGRAALVVPEQDGWICGSDCIALHAADSRFEPRFLAHLLSLSEIRAQLLERSAAATMPSLSEGNLLQLRLPMPSRQHQIALVSRLDDMAVWTSQCANAMRRQVELIEEHRRALIAAAVTGQIDVTTARRARV